MMADVGHFLSLTFLIPVMIYQLACFLCWRMGGCYFFLFCFVFSRVFRPLGRVHFFYTDKRNGTKEKPPHRVGLRLLCALQSGTGTVNSLSLRQAPRLSGPDFQCSTTQKGIEVKVKRKIKPCRSAVSALIWTPPVLQEQNS